LSDAAPAARTFRGRLKPLARKLTVVVAVSYLVALIVGGLLLRFVGEHWWVTALALYLPRFPLAVPLPIIALALLLAGPRRLLWTQAAAAVVVIFPLMGFQVPWPSFRRDDAPVLRVLSQNVNSGLADYERVASEIAQRSPDIVLMQELFINPERIADIMRRRYSSVEHAGQFLIASRYPIVSTTTPDRIEHSGQERTPRYMRHVVDTPLGRVTVFNVHPISPRSAFYKFRGPAGLKRAILTGEAWRGEGKTRLMADTGLISAQLGAMAEHASAETGPVIIAGDFNLPTLSNTRHRHLDRFRDGFEEAGWGFGHTYPNREGRLRLWMRLDRIFASRDLDFVDFEVGCTTTSDHYCVVAELQRD
jgi:endonuclease/exonuclease/phosphatase (EEP) superfamily protein YafD